MKTELLTELKKDIADSLKKATVVVSGSTGLIGSRVVNLLTKLNKELEAGITIVGLYKDEQKLAKKFDDKHHKDVTYIKWDALQDSNLEGAVPRADYVIHCAGISGGSKMHLKDPLKVFDVGILGTKKLLDFCATRDAAFLYVSTYEVYGPVSEPEPFAESHPCELNTFDLRNIYAEIKRLCESLCCAYASKYGIKTMAVRLTSSFGTGVSYDDPRFFAEFARCIIEGRNITLKSKGDTVRSYIDADDVATAILHLYKNGETCNAYNLTNMANAISIRGIAEKMINNSSSQVKLIFDIATDSSKLGFRQESQTLMDCNKLTNTGWQPVYDMDETIEKMITSMREERK